MMDIYKKFITNEKFVVNNKGAPSLNYWKNQVEMKEEIKLKKIKRKEDMELMNEEKMNNNKIEFNHF